MNHIGGFFSKVAAAFANSNAKKEIFAAACKAQGIDLKPEQIEFQGKDVRLQVSPAARTAIFMKKTAILAEVNKSLKQPISDIR